MAPSRKSFKMSWISKDAITRGGDLSPASAVPARRRMHRPPRIAAEANGAESQFWPSVLVIIMTDFRCRLLLLPALDMYMHDGEV